MGLVIDIERKLPGFKLKIDLSCGREIIGILGPSGAGKSMLLNCIAGLTKPDRGKIIVGDVVFFDSEKKINISPQARKTGYLFQNYAIFPHLTVAENIAFGLGKLPKAEQQRRVSVLLESFHLSEMGKRYPSQLSGGQQQRVVLARAMAVEPRIMLLDEPFSALDEHLKIHMLKEMMESLQRFQGITFFVTHNVQEAFYLCDRIAVLNNGRVETIGPKEEVFRQPVTLATAKITGCKNIAAAVRASDYSAEIPEWGIRVATARSIENQDGFIGIRANSIKLAAEGVRENCFPVWIAAESEAPFSTTLFVKIGSVPRSENDFHLEWEISREQRAKIGNPTKQLRIHLDPEDVFFMAR